MVCSTPETEEEKEKRLAAAARARKAEAAERKRQERYRKEREAQVAYNTLRTHATTEKSLNDEIAAAIITLLEANPTVKKKITKAVSA
jgi:ADP-ribosylglycohydrolase